MSKSLFRSPLEYPEMGLRWVTIQVGSGYWAVGIFLVLGKIDA